MRKELAEVLWLDEHFELSLTEVAELSGLPEADLNELVEYGAITPIDPRAARQTFRADCIIAARTACRLRHDFELEPHGLALALTLLERVHELEVELRELHAQSPRRIR